MKSTIIITDNAKCRDCYRCVRVCPVKAIKISEGQAQVESPKCILCGTCVRECPQKAKRVRNDIDMVNKLIESAGPTIASVAPSYPAAFGDYGNGLLTAALKKIGFDMVTETAVGAELVAKATADLMAKQNTTWITSACPVVVNLIDRYYPDVCKHITPLVSPMVAHAIYLKSKYGKDAKVVFIGPCVAKKGEVYDEAGSQVDAVLTFEELQQAFTSANINRNTLQPMPFDDVRPKNAQLFPLEGGLAKTASIASGLLREDFIGLSGDQNVRDMIDHLSEPTAVRLFEALFCSGGCVNGACMGSSKDSYTSRSKILAHHKRKTFEAEEEFDFEKCAIIDLHKEIIPIEIQPTVFTETQLTALLAEIGKFTAEDEYNCGACGYSSCRANAAAVLSGMAEHSMCIPWMRQMAERKTDQIIDNSPNGIVMVDSEFNVVSFNPAFAQMFQATDRLIGRPISTLMDPEDFERVAAEVEDRIIGKIVSFPQYDMIAAASIYRLDGENVMIGIYGNITKPKEDESRITRMRAETLASAESLISKQMRMAQEIASILGETTSETRVMLRKLTELAREVDEQQEKK